MKRKSWWVVFLLVVFVGVWSATAIGQAGAAEGAVQVPTFQIDPTWPKQLPNRWILGNVIGMAVDRDDHVWLLHRPARLTDLEKAAALNPPQAECCIPAPPVLVFDQAGNLLRHWGGPGPGYDWQNEHGIYVDHQGNVWIGSGDVILKFTNAGKFLLQIGRQEQKGGSNDTANLGRPTKVQVDPAANEVYVSDGYGNRRVVVFDAETGKYKRHWGAYGKKPDDGPLPDYNPNGPLAQQFRSPVHCVTIGKDGLVYVCDRGNNRVQVFRKDGTFVKEAVVNKNTLGYGASSDIGFSLDPQQRFLYLLDGMNSRVNILLRESLQLVGWFGHGGRQPGQFSNPHSMAVDSKGNLYIGETITGNRVQRFVYKGMGPSNSTPQSR